MAGRLDTVIELRAGAADCTISPADGGRLARLAVDGRELLVVRPDSAAVDQMGWGCYPMAPWAGRIADGRFHFAGNDYQMQINLAPHAIHGTLFVRPWDLGAVDDTVDGTSANLSAALDSPWPFGGTARQRFELTGDALTCRIEITADDLAMPVQVGWHPWFVKPDDATLSFSRMYHRDDRHIPTGDLVAPTVGPWDDCFVDPLAPLVLHYGDLHVEVRSDCNHWVVYDQPAHATCVEPQSGPPDGFNALPRLIDGEPPFIVLGPHETVHRTITISWSVG